MKYLITLSYVGTGYHGYQVQPNGRSVQETVQDAIAQVLGKRYPLTGCSRTDSGVHAEMFCATVDVTDADAPRIPADRLPIALNRYLPPDISVRAAEVVADDFHPRYAVAWKQYCYRIYTASTRDPFLADRVYYLPRRLDVARMQAAAEQFVGRHDFAGFMASGSDVQDTVRTIYHFAVTQNGDMVEIRVTADGFLYNMVRILVGTLLAVSAGKLSPEEIPALLESKDRSRAGETAPACGLYLEKVSYTPYDNN